MVPGDGPTDAEGGRKGAADLGLEEVVEDAYDAVWPVVAPPSLLRGVLELLPVVLLPREPASAARSRSFTRLAAALAASAGLMYFGVLGPLGDVAARIAWA